MFTMFLHSILAVHVGLQQQSVLILREIMISGALERVIKQNVVPTSPWKYGYVVLNVKSNESFLDKILLFVYVALLQIKWLK